MEGEVMGSSCWMRV